MIEKKELNQLCLEWEPDKTGNGMTKAMPFPTKSNITFFNPLLSGRCFFKAGRAVPGSAARIVFVLFCPLQR